MLYDCLVSSWRLSISLRQMSDGHVMTVRSAEDHVIRLEIRQGRAVLSLRLGAEETDVQGPLLEEGVFVPVVSMVPEL